MILPKVLYLHVLRKKVYDLVLLEDDLKDIMGELDVAKDNIRALNSDIYYMLTQGMDKINIEHVLRELIQLCTSLNQITCATQLLVQYTYENIKYVNQGIQVVDDELYRHIYNTRKTYGIIGGNHESDISGRQDKEIASDSKETET